MSAARDFRSRELWELAFTRDPTRWHEVIPRDGLAEARRMLRRRATERGFVASVRRLLAARGPVDRLDDHEVIALALRLVELGALRVRFQRKREANYEPLERAEPVVGPAEPEERDDLGLDVEHGMPGEDLALALELTGTEPILVEATPLGTPSIFEAAKLAEQVTVLQSAAAEGTPFCEECARALLEAEAEEAGEEEAAEDADVADLDVAAQAAVMSSAADEGAPFCEECEKARAAAQGDA
jgi:hypothetical protein